MVERGITLPLGREFERGCVRSLRERDVPKMLEWMHDPAVAGQFQADFASMDEADVAAFVRSSWEDARSVHLAIDEGKGYLGTVSLKNVDAKNASAEYAIATRAAVHGTGAAMRATNEILSIAFGALGLNRVFLNVRADNGRARAFYRKVGFAEEGVAREALRLRARGGVVDLVWLSMLASEFGGDLCPCGEAIADEAQGLHRREEQHSVRCAGLPS